MPNIIQLSDIHLFADSQKIYKNRSPYNQLEKIINHCSQNSPLNRLIILSGDLVSDVTKETYDLLSNFLSQIPSPIYVIPGNHDDRDLIRERLTASNISHEKVIHLDNWLIILLDSSTPGINLGSGKLSNLELDRLDSLLEKYPDKESPSSSIWCKMVS
jgi:3',5'-cyclic-AMP phosphodiesterase